MHFSRKVTNYVSSLDNPAAGTTYSVRALCNSTAAAGYDTHLICLQGQKKVPPIEGVKISEFPISKSLGQLGRRLGYSKELFKDLGTETSDLLHLHGLWMLPNIIPGLMAIKQNRPYVISPHGMLGTEAMRFSRRKKRFMLALGQRKVLSNAYCFRATAASEVEEIRAFGLRQPIALLPNGIDLPKGSWPKSRQKFLLSLGRVHPKKGLATLINAWEEQSAAFPEWTLRIVGPDEVGHKAELRALITNRAVPRVTIEDAVFGEAKWSLMSGARVFVLPTLNENFANTVPESLILGVPVISSKGAPWAGLEKNGCGWWVEGNVQSMGAAMARAMSLSDDNLEAMGRLGEEWMLRDFQWNGIGKRTCEVYDWMLGKGEATSDIIFD